MPTLNLGRVGFVNKGTWLISTAYKINDTVTYLGGTYACLVANTGQTPILGGTIYWQEWVSEDTVHKSGTETITGQKTFSLSPIIPTPADGDSSTKSASTAFVAAAIPYNINAATAKITPVNADLFPIVDSAASNVLKKITWGNVVAALSSLFAPTLSPAFTGTPTAPTAAAGTNTTQLATTAFANSLVAEYLVAGTAVTSIDFSGLDINANASYRFEIDLYNPTVSTTSVYCFINGDTTITDYYSQLLQGFASTANAGNVNNPAIMACSAGQSAQATGSVSATLNNTKPRIMSWATSAETTSLITQFYSVVKTAAVANITQLTFTTSIALAFGVGTRIRIYRGNI